MLQTLRSTRSTHITNLILVGWLLTWTVACTSHRAYVDYGEVEDVRLVEGAPSGTVLGQVKASEGGAIWRECTDVARGALWVLVDDAERMGANAIGGLVWMPDHPKYTSDRPSCKRGWGWFLVWPVLATPAFMRVVVEGTAYRIEEGAEAAGLWTIPTDARERTALIDRLVSEAPMFRQLSEPSGP